MNSWCKYPESVPDKSGYYYTVHLMENKHYYKAIWWDQKAQHWLHWRPQQTVDNVNPHVLGFVQDSRNDYYVPCIRYAEENVKTEFGVE